MGEKVTNDMSASTPTLWQNFRQVIGRALRETGQSLHRLGVKTASLAVTKHDYYDDPCIYEDHLSRHRQLFPLLISGRPVLHRHIAYVAPCATLIGSVYVGRNSSIWYGAVLRGDTCENTASLTTRYRMEEGLDDEEEDHGGGGGRTDATTRIKNAGVPPQLTEGPPLLATNAKDDASSVPNTNDDRISETTAAAAAAAAAEITTTNMVENQIDTSVLQNVPPPWPLSDTRRKDQLDHHGGAIFIGANTNVQDAAIITSYQNHCTIGNNVTIGHSAQLHSCTVHDNVLIGMGSIVHSGAVIESNAFIAAGAVVPEHTTVPSGTLWMGNPARYVRDLTPAQREKILYQSSEYVAVAHTHQHVMELGGNVDPETGVAVYITSDDIKEDDDEHDTDTKQLEESSHFHETNGTDNDATRQPSLQQDTEVPVVQVAGTANR